MTREISAQDAEIKERNLRTKHRSGGADVLAVIGERSLTRPAVTCNSRRAVYWFLRDSSDRQVFRAYASSDSAGMARRLRNDRIMSTVSFLFLLSTSDTRFRPPGPSALVWMPEYWNHPALSSRSNRSASHIRARVVASVVR